MSKIEKSIIFIVVVFSFFSCSKRDRNIKSELVSDKTNCSFTEADVIDALSFLRSKSVKKLSSDKASVLPVGEELSLKDITLLSSLVLKEANVESDELLYLKPLKSLKELDISWNKGIIDENISYLLCLPSLEKVNLSGTNISNSSLFYIEKLVNIKFISLPSTITVKGLSALSSLKGLESLSLLHKVSREDFFVLGKFSSLKFLSLSASVIDDVDIRYVRELKGLRRLIVPENISKESIEFIRRELPNCDIIIFANRFSAFYKGDMFNVF